MDYEFFADYMQNKVKLINLEKFTDIQDHKNRYIKKGFLSEIYKESQNIIHVKQINYMLYGRKGLARPFVCDTAKAFFVPQGKVRFEIFNYENDEMNDEFVISGSKYQLLIFPRVENVHILMTTLEDMTKIYRFDDELWKNIYEYSNSVKIEINETEINGVLIKEFSGKSGGLFEIDIPIIRLDDGFSYTIKQLNYTLANKEEIKAFHEHQYQDDQWFIDAGEAVIVLYDGRKESPTYRRKFCINVSSKIPKVIKIPRGILHGYTVVSKKPCNLFYCVNNEYNPDNKDEINTPHTSMRINFDWKKLEFKKKLWF